MTLDDFIKGFAEQFEDTDASEITASTEFQELDEWDSLMVLTVIAYVKTNCGKAVTGKELKACATVEELYNLIESK